MLDDLCAGQGRLIAAAMAVGSLAMTGSMLTGAEAASSNLQVFARVLTHVDFRSMRMPAPVPVTPADVAQGCVDLDEPVQWGVMTNSSTGFVPGTVRNSPFLKRAAMSGPSGSVRVAPGASALVLVRLGQGMKTEAFSLHLRIGFTPTRHPACGQFR